MKLLNKIKEDRGASNTVSFIIIILFVMILLVSFIDVGVYFNAKNELRSAAENGARNVALYGGTGGDLRDVRSDVSAAEDIVWASIHTTYQPSESSSPVVAVKDVSCGPDEAKKAGDEVWCKIKYQYNGLAGNFGLFGFAGDEITVKGVAVSEVSMKKE